MGDLRRHLAHRGQPLRSDQPLLALLQRPGHAVELARQIADLVAGVDADALAVVAAGDAPGLQAQLLQRSQRAPQPQRRPDGRQQAGAAQDDAHLHGVLPLLAHLAGHATQLALKLGLEDVQVVAQLREAVVQFLGAFLEVGDQGLLGLPGVELQLRQAPGMTLELLAARVSGLVGQEAIHGVARALEISGRVFEIRGRQRGLGAPVPIELQHAAVRGLDLGRQIEQQVVPRDLLTRAVQIGRQEHGVGAEGQQQDGVSQESLA